MEPSEITKLELVDAAIRRLQRNGWMQHDMGAADTANCVGGALYWGVYDLSGYQPASRARCPSYIETWSLLQNRVGVGLPVWNDQTNRTVEDVLLLLKQVRAELEESDETR